MAANCQAAATGRQLDIRGPHCLGKFAGQSKSAPYELFGLLTQPCEAVTPHQIRHLIDFRTGVRRILQPLRYHKPPAALSEQSHRAFLSAKLRDLGDRADTEALLATANLSATLDEHYAKSRFLVLQQLSKHDQVPLLENP